MDYLIYKLTSKSSLKSYIGVTQRTLIKRWGEHKGLANSGSKYHLHKAIRKYGYNDFNLEILEIVFNLEESFRLEILYIKKFNTFNYGYNMTTGGDSGPRLIGSANGMYGKSHTIETREKMSYKKKLLVGKLHPQFGKTSPLKGRTYEEIMGVDKALVLKKEKSLRLTGIKRPYNIGNNNPAKRKEVREKISKARSNPITIYNIIYPNIKIACKELNLSRYKIKKIILENI